MNSTELAICNTLACLQQRHHKNYCYITQEKLIRFLKEFYGIDICRRTLNYVLSGMEVRGIIQRYKRTKINEFGKRVYTATAYYIRHNAQFLLKQVSNFIGFFAHAFRVQKNAHNLKTDTTYLKENTKDKDEKHFQNGKKYIPDRFLKLIP